MNTETIQDDQQAVDLDLDEEFLAAIRGCNSPDALEALEFHSIVSGRLAEARSDGSSAEKIAWLTDDVKMWRDCVISMAETDRQVARLDAIHEEIKAKRGPSLNTD